MGRKPLAGERKMCQLRIRLTAAERAALDAAAAGAGAAGTSTWARAVLLREAARGAKKAAKGRAKDEG